jgi:hypothetical protein
MYHTPAELYGLEKLFYDSGKKVPPAHAQRAGVFLFFFGKLVRHLGFSLRFPEVAQVAKNR